MVMSVVFENGNAADDSGEDDIPTPVLKDTEILMYSAAGAGGLLLIVCLCAKATTILDTICYLLGCRCLGAPDSEAAMRSKVAPSRNSTALLEQPAAEVVADGELPCPKHTAFSWESCAGAQGAAALASDSQASAGVEALEAEAQTLFAAFDKDGSGDLSEMEVENALTEHGFSNSVGLAVSLSRESESCVHRVFVGASAIALRPTPKIVDVQHQRATAPSKKCTRTHARAHARVHTHTHAHAHQEIAEIMAAADENSDGVLSFAEFAKGVVPLLQERKDSLHAIDAGSTTAFAASRCVSYASLIRHICVFLALLTTHHRPPH